MRKRHIVPLAVIALMAAASVFAVLHFDELQERIYDGRKASERSALKDPVFADVETGNFFACGLTTSGYVYCWGDNHYGQLGTGSYTELSDQPKLVVDAGGFTNGHVTSITTGDFHTCAVSDGTAYCWGNNMVGQRSRGSVRILSEQGGLRDQGRVHAHLRGREVTGVLLGQQRLGADRAAGLEAGFRGFIICSRTCPECPGRLRELRHLEGCGG